MRYTEFMPSKDTRGYRGVYGTIILTKSWCSECESYAIVKKGILQCCDSRVLDAPERWKRESLATGTRALPSAQYQREQLDRQDNRCFYCLISFGSIVEHKKRDIRIIIHWDHLVPFAYLQSNPDQNFVAACQICNGVKGAKCFQTTEEARTYVITAREITSRELRALQKKI